MTEGDISYPLLLWSGDLGLSTRIYQVKQLPEVFKLRMKFGFFCKVSFPPPRAFHRDFLPMSLAKNLLKNDMIAFRTRRSAMYFMDFCRAFLKLEINKNEMSIKLNKRKVQVSSLPLGLPVKRYQNLVKGYFASMELPPFASCLVVRVARLKAGLDRVVCHRIQQFRSVVDKIPAFRGMVTYMQILLLERSSITDIEGKEMEALQVIKNVVKSVNDEFKDTKWKPVVLMFGSPSDSHLEPFFDEFNYMQSFGIEDEAPEREYIVTETDTNPRRLLLAPYFGVSEMMKEAYLQRAEIPQIRDLIIRDMSLSNFEKARLVNEVRTGSAEFMEEFLMKILLVVIDQTIASELCVIDEFYLDKKIGPIIAKHKELVLVIDYDGTIIRPPLESQFDELDRETRQVLKNLARRRQLSIIITSLRGLDDIIDRVKVHNISYIANHGFVIQYWDEERYEYKEDNDAFAMRLNLINRLTKEVCREGAYIVNHGGVVMFHTGEAPPCLREELAVRARRICEEVGFRTRWWFDGVEARLPVEVHKGEAVEKILLRKFGDGWPIQASLLYIGDDSTDEDAVKYLQDRGQVRMIKVTNGLNLKTHAIVKFPDCRSVTVFLKWLEKVFAESASEYSE